MTAEVFRAIRLLGIPTIVFIGVVAFVPGRIELAIRLYALFLSAVAVGYALRVLRRAYPPARPLRSRARDSEERSRPETVVRLENDVWLAGASAFGLHQGLRPRLRNIAGDLLLSRRRTALDGDPHAARLALGESTWQLLRPDRPPPVDRNARGLPVSELRSVVESLERL